jgi:hypothetical protein
VDRSTGLSAETTINRDTGLAEGEVARLTKEVSGLQIQ